MVPINAELFVNYVTKLATMPRYVIPDLHHTSHLRPTTWRGSSQRHPWCKVGIKEMSKSGQHHPQPPQPNHILGIVVLVTPHLKSSLS
ncbi:hypothetical protein AAG906_018028 [Vitis piasezkii]